ncbi:hypothetical protein TVAG_283500 [Trichomonas vaginalis G3]|uniref:U3 small nucleolar RNA-associated protein n=1 Tax=Trichomonas vaginalis (strain ATCC PRA-98 / G3) TaxID=412133 RepID=A2DEQ4_TRIV3|nr:maturation of SSU-rRNA [Trichomonas vaginalis G3]EAY21181.1 hypothetical protein TVAG_283500 [Trichomonas vaginalis G3]KAI5522288.1 maturation of SSU-rRNA [Trichomonas vaginalis G3]|eukprot:XP_001582167.1 hypothetical protein [Trichomonas vaginalis G3]
MSNENVSVNDLLSDLNDVNNFGDLKKMAQNPVAPLQETSLVAQNKANRKAAFEQVKSDVDAWGIVASEVDKQRTITFGESEKKKVQEFQPVKSELASTVNNILTEQKLTRESQLALEDEAMSKLSDKEIRERVEQLAHLRRLQFYNEMKARRWKKIKSKAFRRLHKREMADIPLEELAEVDPEAFQAKIAKIEADRAKERVTLRHKNTSQWVRRVLARGLKAASADVRQSYEDQLKLGEELTRKIALKAEAAGDEEEEDEEVIQQAAKDSNLKPLLDMSFMKEAAQKKENAMEDLEKAIKDFDTTPSSGIINVASKPVQQLRKKGDKKDNEQKVTEEKSQPAEKQEKTEEKQVQKEEVTEEPKKDEEKEEEKPQTKVPKANPWSRHNKKQKKTINANFQQPTKEELESMNTSVDFAKEGQEEELAKMLGYEDEFKREKEEQAAKEASKDVASMDELHIAGWGSWTGLGAVESEKAKKRRENLEKERKSIIEKAIKERKDANLDGVILNEENDTASNKYAITEVPRGYTNAKQLAAQLSYPIGPEFNSVTGFQKLIQPDMKTVAGQAIEPIFMTKMNKRKQRIDKMKANRKALEAKKSLQ